MQTIVFTKSTKNRREFVLTLIDQEVKINLKNRQPIVGKIVFLSDGEDLLRKDLIRFKFGYKAETKIFNITEFEVITIYEKETV